jgi:hypothetical protein
MSDAKSALGHKRTWQLRFACPLYPRSGLKSGNSASLIASRLRLLRGPLARRAVKLQVGQPPMLLSHFIGDARPR